MLQDFSFRPSRPIGTVRTEGVPYVDDGEEPGWQGDGCPGEAAGIAAAVPFLVVIIRDIQRLIEESQPRKEVPSYRRMPFHDFKFLIAQGAGLEEYRIRYTHLAYVVEKGSVAYAVQFLSRYPEASGQLHRHARHAAAVPLGLAVAELQGFRPAFDSGLVGFQELLVGASQPAQQGGIVQGHGGLAGEGPEIQLPARILPEGASAIELQDPDVLAFHREPAPRVEEKALGGESRRSAEAVGVRVQVGDDDRLGRLPGRGRRSLPRRGAGYAGGLRYGSRDALRGTFLSPPRRGGGRRPRPRPGAPLPAPG